VRAAAPTGATARIDRDGSYLVTGGLGRLGTQVALWLAESGAGHIVLVGRRGLPDRAKWESLDPASDAARQTAAVRDIERAGARVSVIAADVADRGAVGALVARCGGEWPALKGIVHAAGVIDHCAIDRLQESQVAAVFRAKVDGAWVLHEVTQSLELDFFALFSSASAAWGSRELGHYAAANHFLDALAHLRRAQGLPATSVNWGWWAGGGTSAAADEFFAQIGLAVMPPDAALGVLGDLLASAVPQRVVAAVDWSIFKPVFEATGSHFLDRIEVSVRRGGAGARRRGELRRAAEGRTAEETSQLVVDHVRAQVADVLGREPAQADTTRGFFKMGMDSLMTVELRRRLEVALDEALPATIAFEYPTIAALAAFICRTVLNAPPAPAADSGPQPEVGAAVLELETTLADRSTDELATLLDRELGQILGEKGRAN
jgi:myxalamid-type polyketide synthase MxaE and MxaD